MDDNESLKDLGVTFLTMLSLLPRRSDGSRKPIESTIDCDLLLPLIGAVALDSNWNRDVTSAVVDRLLGDGWLLVKNTVTSKE